MPNVYIKIAIFTINPVVFDLNVPGSFAFVNRHAKLADILNDLCTVLSCHFVCSLV